VSAANFGAFSSCALVRSATTQVASSVRTTFAKGIANRLSPTPKVPPNERMA